MMKSIVIFLYGLRNRSGYHLLFRSVPFSRSAGVKVFSVFPFESHGLSALPVLSFRISVVLALLNLTVSLGKT